MSLTLAQRDAFRRVVSSTESLATTMVTVLVDMYGTEALNWSPETVPMELAEDLGMEVPKFALDRLMAAINLLTSDDFYKRLWVFNQTCRILSGDEVQLQEIVPADPFECAWGITEAVLLSPPDDEEPFTEEIRGYIGRILDKAGIRESPDVLRIAIRDSAADYGDLSLNDPAMFGAEFQHQMERGEDIEAAIKETLAKLIRQLEGLPMANGDARELVRRARQSAMA